MPTARERALTGKGLPTGGKRFEFVVPGALFQPDGSFSLVLPKAAAGQTVYFWESQRQFFSTQSTKAGGPVDLSIYPKRLPSDAPENLSSVKLPG